MGENAASNEGVEKTSAPRRNLDPSDLSSVRDSSNEEQEQDVASTSTPSIIEKAVQLPLSSSSPSLWSPKNRQSEHEKTAEAGPASASDTKPGAFPMNPTKERLIDDDLSDTQRKKEPDSHLVDVEQSSASSMTAPPRRPDDGPAMQPSSMIPLTHTPSLLGLPAAPPLDRESTLPGSRQALPGAYALDSSGRHHPVQQPVVSDDDTSLFTYTDQRDHPTDGTFDTSATDESTADLMVTAELVAPRRREQGRRSGLDRNDIRPPVTTTTAHKTMDADDDDPSFWLLLRNRKAQLIISFLVVVFIVLVVGLGIALARPTGSSGSQSPTAVDSAPTIAPTPPPTPEQQANEDDEDDDDDDDLLTFQDVLDELEVILTEEQLAAIIEEDVESIYYIATEWLINDIEAREEDEVSIGLLQRFVLALFYEAGGRDAAGGRDDWRIEQNWLSELEECTWYGITCNEEGEIIFIQLISNDLSGTIPSELALIQTLEIIDLQMNGLEGTIPSEFGELEKLSVLNFELNSFTGPLPTTLGQAQSLNDVSVGFNALTGNIPSEIGLLSNLRLLDISDNDFSSTVPSELGKLRALKSLWLVGNPGLSGTMPNEVCALVPVDEGRFGLEMISISCEPIPIISCSCCICDED